MKKIEYKSVEMKQYETEDPFLTKGWGNGYVGVPEGHPWYGLDYDKIDVTVHGGLTYSQNLEPIGFGDVDDNTDLWWVGFDTGHWNDNLENWSQKEVENETFLLYQQAVRAAVRAMKGVQK